MACSAALAPWTEDPVPFVGDPPFLDAGAFDDPFVVGIDHLFQIGVGQPLFGKTHADAGDAGRFQRPCSHVAVSMGNVGDGPAAITGCGRYGRPKAGSVFENRPAAAKGPFRTVLTPVKLDDIGRGIKEGCSRPATASPDMNEPPVVPPERSSGGSLF